MFDNFNTIQLGENNQTNETNQQLVILKHVTTNKTLEEILMDISKQVLETKYIMNLGQLLRMILDIKSYILNLVPSTHVLSEPAIVSFAIDHQMATIDVQVGKNFIEDVLLDGD